MSTDALPFGRPRAVAGLGLIDASHDKTRLVPPKVFARPFRLVFKKKEDDTVTWVEVRTLDGLRRVASRLEPDGDLVETSRFATLEMQLWGHLAEHAGFMRYQATNTAVGAGLAPLGEAATALVDDLASLVGDDAAAIEALGDAVSLVKRACAPRGGTGVSTKATPSEPKATSALLDESGVLLNPEGVEFLRGMVVPGYEKMSPEAKKLQRETDTAIELMMKSEPEERNPDLLTPEQLAEMGVAAPEILTGNVAAQVGLAVEAVRPLVGAEEIIQARENFLAQIRGVIDEAWLQTRLVDKHPTEHNDRLILFIDLDDLSPEQVRATTDAIKSVVKDLDVRLVQPDTPSDDDTAPVDPTDSPK